MAARKQKQILMVSSAVYGFEDLLDRIYASLSTLDYEVWMSHKGTMPVHPGMTALEGMARMNHDTITTFNTMGILFAVPISRAFRQSDALNHDTIRTSRPVA
jgi:hypothetical protein